MSDEIRIDYVPLASAVLWDRNPKQHDMQLLVDSIERYGFQDPPKFDEALSALVYGNGRAEALQWMKQQGRPAPRGIRVDEHGDWLIPIKFGVDLVSRREAEAFAIDHNMLTPAGGDMTQLDLAKMWEPEGYTALLEELAEEDALPASVDGDDLNMLLRELAAGQEVAEDPGPQIDRAEELQEKWQVEFGQVWEIGRHRLMCGDSTSADDVTVLLAGNTPNLMVTDPPYGVNYDPNWRNEAAKAGHLAYAALRTRQVQNDDVVDWSPAYLLFSGNVAYTWSPGGDHVILTGLAVQRAGFQIRNQIIWVKPHFPISRGHYTYQHEPCWYGVRKGQKAHWTGDFKASTKWEIALDHNVDGGHSTQKPVECMQRPIRNHQGEVYDPFVGSGTTIIAAENEGRRCYAMDIDPAYVAVTLERMAGLGLTPQLVE